MGITHGKEARVTRRICVITGSRADYGHLQPVMAAIAAEPALILQVLVCGQHLDPRFGDTWKEVAREFTIDAKVSVPLRDDSNLAVAEATGAILTGVARELARLKPDIVMVLGDRYEILAAGTAALLLNIPIAHLHGGEITEGAMDDAMRHALSKMAALHFVAAQPYRARLLNMGETPDRVIVSGTPGLDNIDAAPNVSPQAIVKELGLDAAKHLFLITYHPVTLTADAGLTGVDALLKVLGGYEDTVMIFTGINSDPGHAALRERVAAFVAGDPRRRVAVQSLGHRRYRGLMKASTAVIGNSSSGLIEAPAFRVPSVNIGDRQKGRLRSSSVIDCGDDAPSIRAAILRALDPAFRTAIAAQHPAYGGGGAAQKIVAALRDTPLTQLSTKRFHDIIPSPS